MNKQKIAIAADHAGFGMKKILKEELLAAGHGVEDLGTDNAESVDYPDFARKLAEWVAAEKGRKGVLICGSGIGMSMAANRVLGVRAALCINSEMADLARKHNDANVLCLGARLTSSDQAREILKTFLTAPFEGGRHQARVEKMG